MPRDFADGESDGELSGTTAYACAYSVSADAAEEAGSAAAGAAKGTARGALSSMPLAAVTPRRVTPCLVADGVSARSSGVSSIGARGIARELFR